MDNIGWDESPEDLSLQAGLYGGYESDSTVSTGPLSDLSLPTEYGAQATPEPSGTGYGTDTITQQQWDAWNVDIANGGNAVDAAYEPTVAQTQQHPATEPYIRPGTTAQRPATSGFGGMLTSLAGSYAAWQAAEAGQKPTAAALAAAGQSSALSSIRSALSMLQGVRQITPSVPAQRATGEGGKPAPGQPRREVPRPSASPKSWMEKYGLMALGAVAVGGLAYKVATTS